MTVRPVVPIAIACLLAAVSLLAIPAREAASWRVPFSPELLEPSGPHAVGVHRMRLDTGNDDPWNPGHARVVMVSVHYPATAGEHPLDRYGVSSYMDELAMLAWAPVHEQHLGLHERDVNWLFRTHSHQWAPPRDGQFPVVVISAPEDGMRTSFTTLAEDLASHGIVAVTVDHPYDAPVVELWPTREVIEASDAERELSRQEADAARAAEVAAVADRVAAVDEEIETTTSPGCTVVLFGELKDRLSALSDDPMIEAQIAERYPSAARALRPLPTEAQAERDFQVNSAGFREALAERLAEDPGCHSLGRRP